jgi:hypothetical protein
MLQKGAFWLGCVALAISLAMAYSFGAAMSWKHGAMFVIVDMLASLLIIFSGVMAQHGAKAHSNIAFAAGAAFTFVALFTHLGFTSALRTESVSEATLSSAAYAMRSDTVDEKKDLLKTMQDQLQNLREKNAWSASVTADGLRQQVAGHELDIEQETARGGCKSKCLKKVKALGDLNSQIATLETQNDLVSRIEATERVIADAKEATINTTVKSSPVKAQTAFLPRIVNVFAGDPAKDANDTASLDASAVQQTVTDLMVSVVTAFATTFAPSTLFWLAFWGVAGAAATNAVTGSAGRAAPSGNHKPDDSRTRTVTNTVPGSFQSTDALGRRRTVTITPHAVAA